MGKSKTELRRWIVMFSEWHNPSGEWRIHDSKGPGIKDEISFTSLPSEEVISLKDLNPAIEELRESRLTGKSSSGRSQLECVDALLKLFPNTHSEKGE